MHNKTNINKSKSIRNRIKPLTLLLFICIFVIIFCLLNVLLYKLGIRIWIFKLFYYWIFYLLVSYFFGYLTIQPNSTLVSKGVTNDFAVWILASAVRLMYLICFVFIFSTKIQPLFLDTFDVIKTHKLFKVSEAWSNGRGQTLLIAYRTMEFWIRVLTGYFTKT
jgi:hypothetical protein